MIIKAIFAKHTSYSMIFVNKIYSVINRDFHIYIYLWQIGNEAIYWSELIFFFPLSQCPICKVEVLTAAHCWLQIFLTAKTWLFPNPCSCIVRITKLMWQTCSVFQELQHTCHQIEARMHKLSLYFGSRTDDWNYFLLLIPLLVEISCFVQL